jgi:hypothetical protein
MKRKMIKSFLITTGQRLEKILDQYIRNQTEIKRIDQLTFSLWFLEIKRFFSENHRWERRSEDSPRLPADFFKQ